MEEKILIRSRKSSITNRLIPVCFISLCVFLIGITLLTEAKNDDFIGIWAIMTVLPIIIGIPSLLCHWWMSKCEIIVTNKRVYGICVFNKRVDLPMDSISAVGTSFFDGIDIGTSSGRINFKLCGNNINIHSEISKLLLERQQRNQSEKNTDSTDVLQTLEKLMDNGIITQEEFDAKKKQLLGL